MRKTDWIIVAYAVILFLSVLFFIPQRQMCRLIHKCSTPYVERIMRE